MCYCREGFVLKLLLFLESWQALTLLNRTVVYIEELMHVSLQLLVLRCPSVWVYIESNGGWCFDACNTLLVCVFYFITFYILTAKLMYYEEAYIVRHGISILRHSYSLISCCCLPNCCRPSLVIVQVLSSLSPLHTLPLMLTVCLCLFN